MNVFVSVIWWLGKFFLWMVIGLNVRCFLVRGTALANAEADGAASAGGETTPGRWYSVKVDQNFIPQSQKYPRPRFFWSIFKPSRRRTAVRPGAQGVQRRRQWAVQGAGPEPAVCTAPPLRLPRHRCFLGPLVKFRRGRVWNFEILSYKHTFCSKWVVLRAQWTTHLLRLQADQWALRQG